MSDLVDWSPLDGPRPPAGPHRPLPGTPRQAPGSVRRTTTTDTLRPDGALGPATAVVLRGRDRRLGAAGEVVEEVTVAVRLALDPTTAEITAIDGAPGAVSGLDGLLGASVRGGFGRVLASVLGDELALRTLRASILEDLAGAVLVSGYAPLRAGAIRVTPGGGSSMADHQGDICIGWAAGGEMHTVLVDHDHVAVPLGPVAPALEGDGLPGADGPGADEWHPDAPLVEGTVRRRRRLDVGSDPDGSGGWATESHLRDTFRAADGDDVEEMVLHEYVVRSRVGDDGRFTAIEVDPRTLPWRECADAAPSARALVGVAVAEVAERARTELIGNTTCTHLSSTLRALADLQALVPTGSPGSTAGRRGGSFVSSG